MKDGNTTEEQNNKLGEYVRERRESRGISLAVAGFESDLHHTYWRKLEAGEYRMPSPLALDRIAEVLECQPADLYALAGYKPTGELPTFKPYLRAKSHLPPAAIDQLESYYKFLRAQYGISDDQPVFPPKPKDERDQPSDRRAA
jgi:transcriptional regulator with XRE-family HTH domain